MRIYGNTINIAARMEEAAKVLGVACIISGDVAKALSGSPARLVPIAGMRRSGGIVTEIPIFEYRVAHDAAIGLAVATAKGRAQRDARSSRPAYNLLRVILVHGFLT